MEIGRIRRERWPYFVQMMGLPNGNVPGGGSRRYSWGVGGTSVNVYAEFGPVDVYVSASAERQMLRDMLHDARTAAKRQ